MDQIEAALRFLLGLGLESKELTLGQMVVRAAVVYVVTVAVVRLAKKRFMGRATAFDVILGIMLGSVVSRAITGNAPLFPALAAAATLVGMHWVFSAIAVRWHGFGLAVKGQSRQLVRDGKADPEQLWTAHMTEHDLREDLRAQGVSGLEEVREARLERSGQVSVIKAKSEPKVVEVAVADGVQTVRIQLS